MPKSINVSVRHGWQAALILPNEFFDQPVGAELAASAVSVSSATAELTTGAGGGSAWYLATGRSPARWMSLPTPLTVNYGTSAYAIEFELAMTNASDAQAIIGQTTNSQYNGFYFTTGGRLQVSVANSNIFFTNASYGLFDGNFHKYRFEHDAGGAWRAYRDDVLFQSSTYSGVGTTSTPLNALFRIGSTAATAIIDIKYLEVTGFGSGSARWDATLSGGTGDVWPTVSGTNDATQSGTWPADNSEWFEYSTGGGAAAQLQAAASAVSSATAVLTTAIRLAAAATAIAACSAGLSTGIRLQSSAVSVSTATASLTTQTAGMSAAAVSQSSASASLTTGIRLAAGASSVSTSSASLATGIRLVAAASGVSTGSAALTTGIRLTASAVGSSAATAGLTTQIRLQGAGTSTATSTAALSTQIRLTAAAVSASSASATLAVTSAALNAAAYSVSSITASLSTSIRLSAGAVAQASASAELTTLIQLSAAMWSESFASAELTTGGQLPDAIDAYKIKMTRITGAYNIQVTDLFSIKNSAAKFELQQQGSFAISNITPRYFVSQA